MKKYGNYNNSYNQYYDAITKTDEPYNLAAGVSAICGILSLMALAVVLFVISAPLLPAIITGSAAGLSFCLAGVFGLISRYKRNQEITDRYNEDRKHFQDIDNKIYGIKQEQNVKYPQNNQQQNNQNINNQKNQNNYINNQSNNDLNNVNQRDNYNDISFNK